MPAMPTRNAARSGRPPASVATTSTARTPSAHSGYATTSEITAMIAAGGASIRMDPSVSSATRRRVASAAMPPLRAVLFDFGHTLVDFHRTEEALRGAYEQIRARIE